MDSKGMIQCVMAVIVLILSGVWAADNAADPSPADNLPSHIQQLTYFGQRADWSHDGHRILFLERTFGDVFEVEVATGIIRPVTYHFLLQRLQSRGQ